MRDLVVAAEADVARAEVVDDEAVEADAGFEPEGADRSACSQAPDWASRSDLEPT